MKLGYADPPYIGCAHLYKDHPDFAGEVDHIALVERLESEFDGWALHASAANHSEAIMSPLMAKVGARKPVVSKRIVPLRDWLQESITLKRGLTGAKPEKVCHWVFEVMGACPGDELHDLFPGTGAVAKAWKTWEGKFALPVAAE